MGRTIEDSNGNFIEISDDGFVSVNGNPFSGLDDNSISSHHVVNADFSNFPFFLDRDCLRLEPGEFFYR